MPNIYNQFSDEYNKLFKENIIEFISKHKAEHLDDNYYNIFYPSFGIKSNESCDFLIIGQAPKGWESGFNTNEIIDEISNKAIEASNSYCEKHNHSPIDWVNVRWTKSLFNEHIKDEAKKNFYDRGDYYCYRSFFWNVTYKLVCDYYNMDRNTWDWSKKIVWSNLYKIAPEDENPSERQKNMQLNISSQLIQKEIEELKPKFCIVLTSENWWSPFRDKMKNNIISINPDLTEIISYEKFLETQIIVTTRPFLGKNEKHVEQILKLIKK